MVALAALFHKLKPKRILVAGDFILDKYIFGKSKRISPEAPVPVVLVDAEENRAGGAGNVALNLSSLGMEVSVLGRIGNDSAGKVLEQYLEKEGIKSCLYKQRGFQTPSKTRIIASNQQVVRIDHERVESLYPDLEEEILHALERVVKSHDLVAISDYAKGFLTEKILQGLITFAKKSNIPVIADPKGSDFTKYRGSTVLKPNLGEAIAASHLPNHSLSEVAKAIFEKVDVEVLMITRSEAGISLFFPNDTSINHPVQAKAIRDVTGAGDTVLAMVSCALANGLSVSEAAQFGNIAATIAVEQVGCAQVTLPEVARRLAETNLGSKIFTQEHFHALEHALHKREFSLLTLTDSCEVSPQLLREVCSLKTGAVGDLVVALSPNGVSPELLHLLSALKDVDYIHIREDNLQELTFATPPKKVVHFT